MSTRKNRADGEETKKRILAAAAERFARSGYHNTSAKDICNAAGVSTAAINYHFNGKDGLYELIIFEAIEHFLNLDFLRELDESPSTHEEKLDRLIRHLVANVVENRSWHGKVWAREIVSPSPLITTVLAKQAQVRAGLIKKIMMKACNLTDEDDDIKGTYALFTLLAPCMMLMIVNPDLPTPIKPIFSQPQDELVNFIKHLILHQSKN